MRERNADFPEFYRRQAMFIEALSCNCCCSGKATTFAYYECVSVALGSKHARRMRDILICGLPGSTLFFHIIS